MTVNLLPPGPDPTDPENFDAAADTLVASLNPMITEFNADLAIFNAGLAEVAEVAAASPELLAAADEAAASEAAAAVSAAEASELVTLGLANPGLSSVSTTSLAIGAGTKTLTIETGKSFRPGYYLVFLNSYSNYMVGICTAYNTATGVLTIESAEPRGSGTYAAWTVGIHQYDALADASYWAFLYSL